MGVFKIKIQNIQLNNIKKFSSNVIFDFSKAKEINTISGRNGSGKSTIFEALMLIQKGYFAQKMINSAFLKYKGVDLYKIVGDESFGFVKDLDSYIKVTIKFENKDIQNINLTKSFSDTLEKNELGEFEDITINLEFKIHEIQKETVKWEVIVQEPYQERILELFWDLEQPKCIMAYIAADRTVEEKDVTFESLKLDGEKGLSPIISFIFEPNQIYYNLYSIMINDYIYERIIPQKPKKNKYFDEAKQLLSSLIPYIKISNFSGKYRENQFILLANTLGGKKNFDVRQFSSGEKLIWYTLLLLSYIEDMGILIIDEPENHLHEELANKFIKLLETIIQDNLMTFNINLGQTYLITHSKTLIYNNFGSGENYLLGLDNLNKIEYENCEKSLRSLGLSYTNDKILFVEGESEITLLQNLLVDKSIKVRELGNCAEVIRTYNGLLKIKEYLSDPQFIFLIDRDTRDEKSIEEMRDKNPEYFDEHFIVLKKHEIENYFIDLNAIKKTVDSFAEVFDLIKLSDYQIKEKVKAIADECLEVTKKKYMNNVLRNKLSTVESFIKQRDINISSKEKHSLYINGLFGGDSWSEVKNELNNVFDLMESLYSEEEWEQKWLDLVDGKIVYRKVLRLFAKEVGVIDKNFEKKLMENIVDNKSSDFMKLISQIESMFNRQNS